MSLREMGPKLHRPFRGTMLKVMAPLSFVLASLAIYWAMWPTTNGYIDYYFRITNLFLL